MSSSFVLGADRPAETPVDWPSRPAVAILAVADFLNLSRSHKARIIQEKDKALYERFCWDVNVFMKYDVFTDNKGREVRINRERLFVGAAIVPRGFSLKKSMCLPPMHVHGEPKASAYEDGDEKPFLTFNKSLFEGFAEKNSFSVKTYIQTHIFDCSETVALFLLQGQ